jgi:excisionase family DNA binding protein
VKPRINRYRATTPKPDSERIGWRVNEFAALVNVSRAHLYRMAKANKLTIVRIGDAQLVPRSEAVRLGLIAA